MQFLDGFVGAATSPNVTFGASTASRLARDLPNVITFEPPPCIWFMMKTQKPMKRRIGRMYVSIEIHPSCGGP